MAQLCRSLKYTSRHTCRETAAWQAENRPKMQASGDKLKVINSFNGELSQNTKQLQDSESKTTTNKEAAGNKELGGGGGKANKQTPGNEGRGNGWVDS